MKYIVNAFIALVVVVSFNFVYPKLDTTGPRSFVVDETQELAVFNPEDIWIGEAHYTIIGKQGDTYKVIPTPELYTPGNI